jgi:predicted methyltransferase
MRYAEKTEVDPMKLTLSAGLCALLFAGASLIGGYAQAASSPADVITSGGSYVVLDHTAAPGAPADVTETQHRIDPATVRREVEAAGFVFDSESEVLANPADPRTINSLSISRRRT